MFARHPTLADLILRLSFSKMNYIKCGVRSVENAISYSLGKFMSKNKIAIESNKLSDAAFFLLDFRCIIIYCLNNLNYQI